MQALAGYALVENKAYATLPATFYIVGAALMMLPASFIMHRHGRKFGFMLAGCVGAVGAGIAAVGMLNNSFALLCVGALVLGVYNAFGQYYRFAAADSAPPDGKARAISLVLAGGLVGGIVGPQLSKLTRDLGSVPFAWSYAALILVSLASVLVASRLTLADDESLQSTTQPTRPMAEIARNPVFIVAIISSALGYGVMNLLMVATPLAMSFCGHGYGASADVIMWHVIAMFAPSFFTGKLIDRFGVLSITLVGCLFMVACVAVALSGIAVLHFKLALVLLGLGWNFMYVGGSTLLTQTYQASEKAKVQGAHDLLVFCVTAATSFASGILVKLEGWEQMNRIALIPILVAIAAMAALAVRRGRRVRTSLP